MMGRFFPAYRLLLFKRRNRELRCRKPPQEHVDDGKFTGKDIQAKKDRYLTAVALITMTIGLSFVGTIHSTPFGTPARLIELSGTVRDTQGRPVAALKVSLMNWFGESF